MCGRFTLTAPTEIIADVFGTIGKLDLQPRFNIAPTQAVLAIRESPDGGQREAAQLRWGLIPSWAKDPAIGNRLINARGETVREKPSFRAAFKRRRCLIVSDGFFEWQAAPSKSAGKRPHWIHRPDHRPFAFAGLWESWKQSDGDVDTVVESCTIITTTANEMMEPIHARMPVILDPEDHETWLHARALDAGISDALQDLLRPCTSELLEATEVGTHVNSPRNDDVACIAPIR